jgi:hypothetical protein
VTTQWLPQYKFIDAGRFVLYATGSAIYRVPSTDAPNPVLVVSKATSAFDLAPDRSYVATCFSDHRRGGSSRRSDRECRLSAIASAVMKIE